jgi:hypothetical protein
LRELLFIISANKLIVTILQNWDLDKLTRQLVSTTDKFNTSNYEAGLIVVPDSGSIELAKLGSNDKMRVLMHFIPDPKKKTENAWDFVWTTSGIGWLKLLNKSS